LWNLKLCTKNKGNNGGGAYRIAGIKKINLRGGK